MANPLHVERIGPGCRSAKGDLVAFYTAADKLREEYSKRCHQPDGARVTFKLQLLVEVDERGMQGD